MRPPAGNGNVFLASRRRRPVGCILMLLAAGLGLAVVVGLSLQVVLTPDPTPGDTRFPATGPPAGAAPPTGSAGEMLGPLRALDGTRQAAGVQVGYPHSTQGAVSAGVHYLGAIASNLDSARAAEFSTVMAAPAWNSAAAEFPQGPRNTRKALGLPEKGTVPDGVSVMLTPLAYQVQHVEADSVTVLLLGYYQTTLPGQETENRIGVFPAQMIWADGDWKLSKPDLSIDYSTLSAEPGSPEAQALGWLELTIP